MYKEFHRYRLDKSVGPLVAQYNYQTEALNVLKNDLRTSENIHAIISLSQKQLQLENRIWNHVGGRPIAPPRPSAWIRIAELVLKVTIAGLLIKLAILLY